MLDFVLLFNSKEKIKFGLRALKRVIPFAFTFAIGLFVASAFYSFSSSDVKQSKTVEQKFVKYATSKKSKCIYKKNYNSEIEVEFDTTIFPPTPPDTIILKEKLEKSAK